MGCNGMGDGAGQVVAVMKVVETVEVTSEEWGRKSWTGLSASYQTVLSSCGRRRTRPVSPSGRRRMRMDPDDSVQQGHARGLMDAIEPSSRTIRSDALAEHRLSDRSVTSERGAAVNSVRIKEEMAPKLPTCLHKSDVYFVQGRANPAISSGTNHESRRTKRPLSTLTPPVVSLDPDGTTDLFPFSDRPSLSSTRRDCERTSHHSIMSRSVCVCVCVCERSGMRFACDCFRPGQPPRDHHST